LGDAAAEAGADLGRLKGRRATGSGAFRQPENRSPHRISLAMRDRTAIDARGEAQGEVMIDVGFDFRTDAGGRDPDTHSPTLRSYHRLLWSKPLPDGRFFDLSESTRGVYLHHRSALGEFFLSSDSVMQTFIRWPALKPITDQLSESEHEAFMTIGYTIGAMMVFPGNQVDRKWTINQARGCNTSIADRFDLTLECIRRHYSGLRSPLSSTISRYTDFFALFDDFRCYVRFFLLDDLVHDDLSVKFFMPFDDFHPPAVPRDVGVYREYRRRSIEFIEARNRRIKHLDFGDLSLSRIRALPDEYELADD
jgi:hypothetical protein